jgi:hypothetical protein
MIHAIYSNTPLTTHRTLIVHRVNSSHIYTLHQYLSTHASFPNAFKHSFLKAMGG